MQRCGDKWIYYLGLEYENNEVMVPHDEIEEDLFSDDENAVRIRGTITLTEVYDKCNLALSDPTTIEEANQFQE